MSRLCPALFGACAVGQVYTYYQMCVDDASCVLSQPPAVPQRSRYRHVCSFGRAALMIPSSVLLRELGPREGFQLLDHKVSTEDKLRLIELLSETGVPEIEVTSYVRADRVPQMADAEELVARLPDRASPLYTALYLNPKGFERALASGRLRGLRAWISSSVSESFLRANSNMTFAEEPRRIEEWLSVFSRSGLPLHGVLFSTAFGCGIEGICTATRALERIDQLCTEVERQGGVIKEACLADTVGLGNPQLIREVVRGLRAQRPAIEISLHLHDTRGTGMANVYAGLLEGVGIFECSVGGMGGCPFTPGAAGNVPTEDVAHLCESLGVRTNVSLERYREAACFAETLARHPLPGRFFRSGG